MAQILKFLFVLSLVAACSGTGMTTRPTDASTATGMTTRPTDASTATGMTTRPTDASTATGMTTRPTDASTATGMTTRPTDASAAPVTTTGPTSAPDPCAGNPCGQGSTCERRAVGFVCLCLPGDYYNINRTSCENAKIFPGDLVLADVNFTESLRNNTSTEFQQLSNNLTDELKNAFTDDTYITSTVLEFVSSSRQRMWSREATGVTASLEVIFSARADITADTVKKQIENYAKDCNCTLSGGTFTEKDLCERNACHKESTECKSGDGSYNCTCKEGYIETDFSERICQACPSGQYAENNMCQDCPFGRSGFNCQENWQLLLVIIGSVLGGLLLITAILLLVMACRSPKKSSNDVDIGKPYSSHYSARAPLVNDNAGKSQMTSLNGVNKIPRATSAKTWDSGNNLEMTPSNSRQNLVPGGRNVHRYEDPDDIIPYPQNRPQNNPYTQNRPQNNPYSSSHGHVNPYYMRNER